MSIRAMVRGLVSILLGEPGAVGLIRLSNSVICLDLLLALVRTGISLVISIRTDSH